MAPTRFPRSFARYHLVAALGDEATSQTTIAITKPPGEQMVCVLRVLPGAAPALDATRLRSLQHQNLVRVADVGTFGGDRFFVTQLVTGRDVARLSLALARRELRMPVVLALRIARDVAAGLAAAHALPGTPTLLHGALTPSRVLLSWDGAVQVVGTGCALPHDARAARYAQPERSPGAPPDPSGDGWATGAMLWEMLIGRPLVPAAGDVPRVEVPRVPVVEPPSRLRPDVPPTVDALVLRALATDPRQRWPRMSALRDALDAELQRFPGGTEPAALGALLRELYGDEIERERQQLAHLLDEVKRLERDNTKPVGPGGSGAARAPRISQPQSISRPVTVPRIQPPPVPRAAPAVALAEAPRPMPHETPELATQRELDSALVIESEGERAEAPGTIVDGRYRLERVLGQGGMGRVWEAEHVEIGKKVAVKILLPQFSAREELVTRFRREARAASSIGHPNIVDVTDSGVTAHGNVYFVMERLTGIDLADVLRAETRLHHERAVHICAQVCRAVSAAHAAGIIHRDLKPENIYLVHRDDNPDFVKVLDFGIAKAPGSDTTRKLTTPGLAMGTPEYMSPEQAMGNAADPRSDIYSVGAILYELVTGLPPHAGDNSVEVLSKKLTQPPTPPSKLNPDVPEALEQVIMAALAREPAARPQTMAALEYELTKSIKGRAPAVAARLGLSGDQSWSEVSLPPDHDAGATPVDGSALSPVPKDPSGPRLVPSSEIALGDVGLTSQPQLATVAPPPTTVIKKSSVGSLFVGLFLGAGLAAGGAYYYFMIYAPPKPQAVAAPVEKIIRVEQTPAEKAAPLLEWARLAAKNDRFVRPPGDNLKDLLERVAKIDPDNSDATKLRKDVRATELERGKLALKKKNLDDAADAYRIAFEMAPSDELKKTLAGVLVQRADRALKAKQTAGGLADAVQAAELLPDDNATRLTLGDAYLLAGRKDQAEAEYRKILEKDPKNVAAQRRVAALNKGGKKSGGRRGK